MKRSFWRIVYEYLGVTLAGALNAISLAVFVNPNKLVPGGFSGLCSVLLYIIPDSNMSVIYMIVNIPLLIAALILLHGDFTFKTIWATLSCTVVLAIIPPEFSFTDSLLISGIFGGVLIGLSMYVAAIFNGSNGGTEVVGRLIAKYRPEVNLSTAILWGNLIILIVGALYLVIAQGEQIWIVFHSLVFVFVGSSVMGIFSRGVDHPQKFMIVTENYEQMQQAILQKFRRGLTSCRVEGDGSKRIILVVVQYRQASALRRLIKKYDASAFTFVKDVYDIFSRPTFNRNYTYEKDR